MIRRRLHSFYAAVLVTAGLSATMGPLAWGDCRTYYNEAMALLNTATQQASKNQRPNPETFATDFKTIVDKMQTEKCMPELMSLVQHIQAEQQKLATPSDTTPKKPAPIMD